MRLDRLDLVRYGKFTDRTLDFGPVRPGKPDFHLVHGPNEAGKSTLFSAYLDLLFGIEKSSAYGFLHSYSLMRVGGRLSIGGEHHDAYRLKRNQASLVSVDDRPLPDTLFASVLGGMDRNAYRTMFSLDDESIEKGGEDILKSEGELGSMLFSASSGLSDMASGLAALKQEADEFYRPSGRKHGLSVLKAEIEALAAERKTLDVAAREYGILVRDRDAAAQRHEEVTAARSGMRAALAQVERSLSALPYLRRLRALRAELGAFDLGDSPPMAWRALSGELAREEAEIAARAARVEAERERHVEERAALSEDDAALAAEADIAALAGSALEARFRTAAMDLSSREAERDRVVATIGAGIAALGLSPDADPAETLLPPGLGEKLTALLSRRTALVERSEAARRERAEAERALAAIGSKAGAVSDEDAGRDEAASCYARCGLARRPFRRSPGAPARGPASRRPCAAGGGQRDGTPRALVGHGSGAGRSCRPRGGGVGNIAQAVRCGRRGPASATGTGHGAGVGRKVRHGDARGAAANDRCDGRGACRTSFGRCERPFGKGISRVLDGDSAATFEHAMREDDRARDARLRNADRLSELRILERTAAEGAARLRTLGAEATAAGAGEGGNRRRGVFARQLYGPVWRNAARAGERLARATVGDAGKKRQPRAAGDPG
jgi:hypothetical protein